MIQFVRNDNDESTERGFQFEFFCDRCGNKIPASFKFCPECGAKQQAR